MATEAVESEPVMDDAPAEILENGYIDHQVDYIETLSEEASNSWCESASMSEGDEKPDEDYYDEEVPEDND